VRRDHQQRGDRSQRVKQWKSIGASVHEGARSLRGCGLYPGRIWLAFLILLLFATPANAAPDVNRLFIYGDSFAHFADPYMQQNLLGWHIRSDAEAGRTAHGTPAALKGRKLAPVVHLSVGTVDEVDEPERFRRAVRRSMRIIGGDRCVVWANFFRPANSESKKNRWGPLNRILDQEAARRDNLVVVDWASMVERHLYWRIDGAHVDERGSKARARAVAQGVLDCAARVELPIG